MSEKKDWKGNTNSIFKTLGSSNHLTDGKEREINDYYATEPKASKLLIELEGFHQNILEPACGEGHISEMFVEYGHTVTSSDLIDRGYGEVKDFFTYTSFDGDIVTNPPYTFGKEFIEHAIQIVPDGCKVAMFMKVQFLEGKARKLLFEKYPPIRVWVSSSRLLCAKNGKFDEMIAGGGSAVAYAWYIWVKGYKGDTILKWFN
jgi:hypothetical protein